MDVSGGVKDGMLSEKCVLRCVKGGGRSAKYGSGGEMVGARV